MQCVTSQSEGISYIYGLLNYLSVRAFAACRKCWIADEEAERNDNEEAERTWKTGFKAAQKGKKSNKEAKGRYQLFHVVSGTLEWEILKIVDLQNFGNYMIHTVMITRHALMYHCFETQ